MAQVEAYDVLGALRAHLNGVSWLVGKGNPVPNGFHLRPARSSSNGAIGEIRLGNPRTIDDISDTAQVQVLVKAVGSEDGALHASGYGARKVVEALGLLAGRGAVVTTKAGEHVRILTAGQITGPLQTGDVGGEITHTVGVTVRCVAPGS